MTHVVTERCVDCRYTDCCAVCPVDCFYEIESPTMLVIDPVACIDCTLCVPECPVQAIWGEDELPNAFGDWLQRNASLFSSGTVIKTPKDPLPGAVSLTQLQAGEKERGLDVKEPSAARATPLDQEAESPAAGADSAESRGRIADPIPTPAELAPQHARVFDATANSIYPWRTAQAVARQLDLTEEIVRIDLEALIEKGYVQKRPPTPTGKVVYAAAARVR